MNSEQLRQASRRCDEPRRLNATFTLAHPEEKQTWRRRLHASSSLTQPTRRKKPAGMDFVMKQALGGATKDMGKMLGGEEEKDPDAAKKEEERQEALRQQEEERKAKHARMEAEREKVRQSIRDKYGLKKKEEKEAEEKAALEQACEGSLTRPKKAVPRGCGGDDGDDDGGGGGILGTILKFLPGPLQDMFKK
ncbi:complexin-2 isoform X2 [Syngnathoides biaculeatus]|uniref:complexin-2 isoform X2 n=1 Tax=Syngnathoides biaculeatus TaxID=300417 RepID=UPI002ADD9EFE|nr:complexin-2 isoform X2 [Syngnathoides biaculeatus]